MLSTRRPSQDGKSRPVAWCVLLDHLPPQKGGCRAVCCHSLATVTPSKVLADYLYVPCWEWNVKCKEPPD